MEISVDNTPPPLYISILLFAKISAYGKEILSMECKFDTIRHYKYYKNDIFGKKY